MSTIWPKSLILLLIVSLFCQPLLAESEYARKGKDYYGMRRYADALGALRKAIKMNPNDAVALYYLGLVYRDNKNYERAINFFTRACRSNKRYEEPAIELCKMHVAISNNYRQDGNVSDAISELEKIFRAGILSIDAGVGLMELYDAKRRYKTIMDLGNKLENNRSLVIGDDAHWGKVYYYMGISAKKMKQYNLAERLLNRAVNSLREHPNARASYEQVKLIQRKRLMPILIAADRYAKAGEYSNALLKYREALKLDAKNANVKKRILQITELIEAQNLVEKAKKMEQDGLWIKARELLEQASHKAPGNADILVRMRRVDKMLTKLQAQQEHAEKIRREAEDAEQKKFNTLFGKGEEALGRRDYKKAVEFYQKALLVRPKDQVVAERLRKAEQKSKLQERFDNGRRYFRTKNYPQSIREFLELEKMDSDYRGLKKYLAKNYVRTQQYEKAESYLRAYLDKFSRDVEGHYLLAEVYREQIKENPTNTRRALNQYLKVRELEPGYEDIDKYISDLSWDLHKVKYTLIVFLILFGILGYGYSKIRPGRLKRGFLKGLESWASRNKWENIKSVHESLAQHKLSALEEAQARYIFAQAFYETGGYTRCVKECQELMRLKRLTKNARLMLARAYYAMQTISPEVLDLYMDLLAAERDNNNLRAFIGKFCAAKKIVNPQTMPLLKQLAMQDPSDAALRQLLVRGCLKNKDRGSAAMGLYKLEAEQNPENIDVRCVIAEELLSSGKVNEAVQECEEIINIRLTHRKTHEVLLAAYEKMGKLDALARTYQSILEQDPHNAVINHFLQKILHPDGPPDVAPGAAAGTGDQAADWSAQMPAGFTAEQDMDSGVMTAPAGEGSLMKCSGCGREVPAGSYFCECGKPL